LVECFEKLIDLPSFAQSLSEIGDYSSSENRLRLRQGVPFSASG